MVQITEDYVSFEIAKLLKEKGFEGEYTTAYFKEKLVDYTMFGFCLGDELVSAPTLQMAMKWLREVHNIHINIDIHWLHFVNKNGWMYIITKILENGVEHVDCKGDESDKTFYLTYEQAAGAAIKYCLENLI